MKIYLSGPMTGMSDYNYPKFSSEANRLRTEGHHVYNPQEWPYDGPMDEFPIRAAFADYCDFICTHADAIFMLPGWQKSHGARAEWELATRLGLEVVYLK